MLTDERWVRDYIEGMEQLGIKFSEAEKQEIISKNINDMIEAFGGAKIERIKSNESGGREES